MQLPPGFVLDTPGAPPGKRWGEALAGDNKNAGIARTAFDQFGQGMTFNLLDEGQDALGSAAAYGVGKGLDLFRKDEDKLDESFGQIYDDARALSQKRLAQQLEQRPALSIGSNIAGALVTGGAGATTKGGTAVANSLRHGNLAMRAGKAGLFGSASGSAAGFGAGTGLEDRLEKSGDSALVGGIAGGAIPIVGSAANKIVREVGDEVKSLIPHEAKSVKQLRDTAKPLYDRFTQSGGVYSDKLTNEIADLADAARANGIAGSTKKADEALNDALGFYSSLRGKKLAPADLQKLDQSFADDVGRFNKAGEFNFGRILNNLKYEMRDRAFDPVKAADYIESGSPGAVEALKEANRLYAQSYKAADIEKILAQAKGTENPQTSVRTGLKNLLANEKKMKGYNKEEQAILEEALKRGYTGGLIKLIGGRLTNSVGGGITGMAAGGPAGAIGGTIAGKAVGGFAADAAGAIQGNRLRGALSAIQEGAPAVKGGVPAVLKTSPRGTAPTIGVGAAVPSRQDGPLKATVLPEQQSPEMNLPDGFVLDGPQANAGGLLENIKQAESAGDPNAKNPNSSASGLYQFTDSTWRSAVDKWGRRHGIKYSDKNNPQAQEILAQKLTEDNARILQSKGIEPTDGNIYFAHFMGAPAASKAISLLGKNAIAARSFPDAARANPEIFFNNGKPRTIDEVYALVSGRVA